MNPSPVAQKIEILEEQPSTIIAPTPAPIITKSETKKIKRAMPPDVLREQSEDPSFLPFDSEGNIYITNVVIDGDWAIVHGDILAGEKEEIMELERNGEPLKMAKPRFWNKGVVPYTISKELERLLQYDEILNSIKTIEEKTKIRFVKASNEKDRVLFVAGSKHCYSNVGRIGGEQKIVLGPDCFEPQILHEILHTLGLYHEQSRPDRDDHIMIMWENIQEQYHEQFKKMPPLHYAVSEVEFDTTSIMMYPPQAFAREPGDTSILTINGELYQPKQTLSASDILKIKKLYEFED